MDPQLVALVAISVGAGLGFAGIALKAFSTWVNRPAVKGGHGPDLHRIEDLEERLAELEERVDFSERLLAERKHGTSTRRSDP